MSDGDRIVARLFGALLMAVGALIVVLAGLCSAAFLVMMLGPRNGGAASGVGLILIFGGVPIAIGGGVFMGGRALWRGPQTKADPKTFE